MKTHRATASRALAASLLLTVSLSAFAAPPADGDPHFNCPGPDFHGFRGPPGAPPGPRFGGFPREGWGGPPPFLAGLQLTEEQQDKVFAIVHAAAPALREQEKALRKAREALRDLDESPQQYDESRVKGLAETAAKADSQLMVLRARTDHEIRALLTPGQLKQLQEHHHEHGPGDHDGPPPA